MHAKSSAISMRLIRALLTLFQPWRGHNQFHSAKGHEMIWWNVRNGYFLKDLAITPWCTVGGCSLYWSKCRENPLHLFLTTVCNTSASYYLRYLHFMQSYTESSRGLSSGKIKNKVVGFFCLIQVRYISRISSFVQWQPYNRSAVWRWYRLVRKEWIKMCSSVGWYLTGFMPCHNSSARCVSAHYVLTPPRNLWN